MAKEKNKKQKPKNNLKFNILNFQKYHYYLFNVTKYNTFIYGIDNINDIKINTEEINLLKEQIDECNSIKSKNTKSVVIEISPEFFDFFTKIKKHDLTKSEYAIKIKAILNDLKNSSKNVTLKQIAKDYEKKYLKKISLSTVSRILKNHLKIRYLRTTIKNPKLEQNNYILMSFIFLRILLRSFVLSLNLIFIDETGFVLKNDNYLSWRESGEEIYAGPKINGRERLNLILAVSKNKVIHKTFIKGSVNSEHFIDFLDEMITTLDKKEKENSIIIMDNATIHLTKDVIEFFKTNKLKGLTICPYRSNFNMIELAFRFIKNIIYKNIYENIENLKNDVIKIIDGNGLKNSLINLYKETIEQYMVFIQNNKGIDLMQLMNEIKSFE